MKVREDALVNQVRASNKTIHKMKKTVKEAEQKAKTWEENKNRLNKVVTLAWNSFIDEGITHDMFAESKVFHLGEIAENLRKKVTELGV